MNLALKKRHVLNKRQLGEFEKSGINKEYAELNFFNTPKSIIKQILNPENIPAKDFAYAEAEYQGGWMSVHGEIFKPYKPSKPEMKYRCLVKGNQLYEVIHPENIKIDQSRTIVCEGTKKAVSIAQKEKCRVLYFLSLGHGVGLVEDIAKLPNLHLCLDNDYKADPLRMAQSIIRRLKHRCGFKVAKFFGKGVDDAIVAGNHIEWIDPVLWSPQDSTEWDFVEDTRYLSSIKLPFGTRACVVQAPKGNGKSYQLAKLAGKAKSEGRPIIIITHRINLSRALAREFGIPYIDSPEYQEGGSVALCINSIQKLKLSNLEGAYIFIDEAEQVLDDLMFSDTMRFNRMNILNQFRELGKAICDRFKGTFFLASADIEQRHIEMFQKLLSIPACATWKIKNQYRFKKGKCEIFKYSTKKEGKLFFEKLYTLLEEGLKLYIPLAGQKTESIYGTQTVETFINESFPHLSVIRIDSESVGDPSHAAYRAVSTIKELCQDYDVVIASPTLGTGVDIRFDHHVFDALIGHTNGHTSDTDATRQAFSRIRDYSIPRYIFCPEFVPDYLLPFEQKFESVKEFRTYKKFEINQVKDADETFFNQWYSENAISYDGEVMDYWLSRNKIRRHEAANFANLLASKLADEGYAVQLSEANILNLIETPPHKSARSIKEEAIELKRERIAQCPELSKDAYNKLLEKDQHSVEEKYLIESQKIRNKWGLSPTIEVQNSIDKLEMFKKLVLANHLLETTQTILENYNYDFGKKLHIAHDDLRNSNYYSKIIKLNEIFTKYNGKILDEALATRLTRSKKFSIKLCNYFLKPHGLKAKRTRINNELVYRIEEISWDIELGDDNQDIDLKPHLIKHINDFYSEKVEAWKLIKTDIGLIEEARLLNAQATGNFKSLSNKYTNLATRARCLPPIAEPPKPTNPVDFPVEFRQSLRTLSRFSIDIETFAGKEKNFGDDYDYENDEELEFNSADKKGGLNPINGRIRLVTIFDGQTLWVIEARDLAKYFKGDFNTMMANKSQLKIFHNALFDLRFLRWQGFIKRLENISDTMVGSRCLWGDMGAAKVTKHSLKQLAKSLYDVDIDKTEQVSNWGADDLTQSQIEYAALDAYYTYRCWERLTEVCNDPSILGLPFPKRMALEHWQIRNNSIPGFIAMQTNGYIVNENRNKIIFEREQLRRLLMDKWCAICPGITPHQTKKIKSHIFYKYGVALPSLSRQDVVGDCSFEETVLRQQIVTLERDLTIAYNTALVGMRQPLILGIVSGTGRSSSGNTSVSKKFFNFQSLPAKVHPALKDYDADTKQNQKKLPLIWQLMKLNCVSGFLALRQFLTPLRAMFNTDCIIDLPASHGRISAELADDEYAIERYMDSYLDMHCETASILSKICFDEKKAAKYAPEYIKKNKDSDKICKGLRSAAKNTYYGWLNGAGAARIKSQIQANLQLEVSKGACQNALSEMEKNFHKTVSYSQEKLKMLANPANQFIVDGSIFGFMEVEGVHISWFLGKVGQSIKIPATKAFACIWSLTESLLMNKALAKIQTAFDDNPQWGAKLQNYIHDEFNLTYKDKAAARFAYDTLKSEFGAVCQVTVAGFDKFEKCIEGITNLSHK